MKNIIFYLTDRCKELIRRECVFVFPKPNFRLVVVSIIFLATFISPIEIEAQEKKGLKRLLGVHVDEFNDKFEGSTTFRMKGNKVKINGAVGTGIAKGVLGVLSRDAKFSIMTVRLQLENHISKDESNELAVILKVSINDDARFWVMPGESLIFLVDGERIALSTEGDFNAKSSFDSGGDLDSKTNARYLITQSQLETMLKAVTVDFRIMQQGLLQGEAKARDKTNTHFEGTFSKKNFKAWKDFYENYILTTPQKS